MRCNRYYVYDIYLKNFKWGPEFENDKLVEALKIWASGDEAKIEEHLKEVGISHYRDQLALYDQQFDLKICIYF